MENLDVGIHDDIDDEDYHADRKYVSSSVLKLLLKEPKEFYSQYILGIPREMNKDALDFGKYVHSLILEPDTVEAKYAVWQGSMRRGKEYEQFLIDNKGKVILSVTQESLAKLMIESYNNTSLVFGDNLSETSFPVSDLFKDGNAEQSYLGELDGMNIKVRLDYKNDSWGIQDLKTTASKIRGVDDVVKICEEYWYDLSAALYVDLVKEITGVEYPFNFVFISKNDNAVTVFKASKEFLDVGRRKYKEAIRRLKAARESGIYYTSEVPSIPACKEYN